MKKALSVLLSVLMMLSVIVFPNNVAYAASNIAISVSASSVNIGDAITVTVGLPEGVLGGQLDVKYSNSIVKFSSCSVDAADNGASITLNIGTASSATTATITFSAKTSGTAVFEAVPIDMRDNNFAKVEVAAASTSVTVVNQVTETPSAPSTPDAPSTPSVPETPAVSTDNKLGSLKISSGTLSPSFHPDTTKYTVTVGYDVTKVTVSALPSSATGVVTSVTGGNDLQVGENKISITVKAENGVTKTYTITVTRKEKETVSDESQTSETDEAPVEKFSWNGKTLEIQDNIPEDVIPADFGKTTKRIYNEEVPVLEFKDGMLTVLYLADESGNNNLYIYDEILDDVYPFVCLGDEQKYVIVLRPDDASAPTGHIPCTLSIEGKGVVNAYQINTEEFLNESSTAFFGAEIVFAAEAKPTDFYLLYCINQDGEYGWYQYDSVDGTFQRYCTDLHNTTVDAKQDEEINRMMDELESTRQMLLMGAIAAGVLVGILTIVIIVLAMKLRKRDEDFYGEYVDESEDFDEEDDYIEDDEVEIEFYEMPETEIPDMEALLIKEALADKPASEQETIKKRKEIEQPKRVVTPIDVDDDDSDLEFIELD